MFAKADALTEEVDNVLPSNALFSSSKLILMLFNSAKICKNSLNSKYLLKKIMKPSKIKSIKAKISWLLPSRINALTWKGIVYCTNEENVKLINKTDKIDSQLKLHETIHLRQAQSTKDSWFLFYIRYV